MRVSIRILLAMILSLTSLVAQEGVVIESYRWGFDGTVKTQDLNLLTVEVKNAGGEPYDGEVRVRPGSMGLGGSSSIRKRCFLLPGQRRTLQFVLYVAESFNSVTVTIRRGERKVIDDMDEGAGSIILLESSDPLKVTQAPLPRFPEREFPVRGYATAGLSAVILDHVPEFTRAQRQAFLDWLRGGGRVHLYQATGQYPRFGDDLSILNDPRESFRLGMGYVHRSPLSIAEAVRRKSLPDATQTKRRYGSSYSHTTTQILDVLRRTVWPNHNWAVIYLILFAFFMASVPWHYFVSKKAIGYPASICLMLGIVGVTATSIYFVGARGYDERASVHMIAYAKQLDPGRFEVRRHGNVFVTSSGRYTLRFRGAGGEFTCGAAGTSLGEMSRDGSIRVPIPVFTSRPFFHVAVVDASLVEVKVRSWLSEATRDRLSGLSLELDRDVVAAWAFHEDQATRFEKVDDRTIKAGEVILSAELFFNNEGDQAAWRWTANETPFDELCIQQSLPVLADRWRSPKDHRLPQSLTGPDTVRIAVLCRMPDELKLVGQDLMNQEGYVLYDVLLQRPE